MLSLEKSYLQQSKQVSKKRTEYFNKLEQRKDIINMSNEWYEKLYGEPKPKEGTKEYKDIMTPL